MKKIIILFSLFVGLSFSAYSQIDIGLRLGLSTPNDRINDVYNSSNLKFSKIIDGNYTDVYGDLKREGTKSGYHIGMVGRVSLSDDFVFVGGLTYHKFPLTELKVEDIESTEDIENAVYEANQSYITLNAGVNYYFLELIVDVYGVGELQYNYLSSDVNLIDGIDLFPPTMNPTDSRVGAGLGLGVDLDLKLVTLNLEGKYNFANLVGMEDTESSKNYFSLSLCVFM